MNGRVRVLPEHATGSTDRQTPRASLAASFQPTEDASCAVAASVHPTEDASCAVAASVHPTEDAPLDAALSVTVAQNHSDVIAESVELSEFVA